MFDEPTGNFPRKVTDREGILAFSLMREKFTAVQIGEALNLPTISVTQFFENYPFRQPWSRGLKVPPDMTPAAIEDFVSTVAPKRRGEP